VLERPYVHVKPSNLIVATQPHSVSAVTGSPETVMKREVGENPALFPQL
jgi:hypothetical protein